MIIYVKRALTDLAHVRGHDVTAMWKTFLINTERQTATVCLLTADASQNSQIPSIGLIGDQLRAPLRPNGVRE